MMMTRRQLLSLAGGALAAPGASSPLFIERAPAATGIHWVHDNAMSPEHFLPEALGPGCAFLEYDNDGWYGTGLPGDVARYRWLVLRVRGRAGGEERHIGVRLGALDAPLATVAAGAVSTRWSELRIDLRRTGAFAREATQLELTFWQGARGMLEIARVSFEP